LGLEEYKNLSPRFDEDIYAINADSSIASRDVPGGTNQRRVEEALKEARQILDRPLGVR
jgi:argininosuccinate lyase